jgi:hypothetical protein
MGGDVNNDGATGNDLIYILQLLKLVHDFLRTGRAFDKFISQDDYMRDEEVSMQSVMVL